MYETSARVMDTFFDVLFDILERLMLPSRIVGMCVRLEFFVHHIRIAEAAQVPSGKGDGGETPTKVPEKVWLERFEFFT